MRLRDRAGKAVQTDGKASSFHIQVYLHFICRSEAAYLTFPLSHWRKHRNDCFPSLWIPKVEYTRRVSLNLRTNRCLTYTLEIGFCQDGHLLMKPLLCFVENECKYHLSLSIGQTQDRCNKQNDRVLINRLWVFQFAKFMWSKWRFRRFR